jgi:hypothetical protein
VPTLPGYDEKKRPHFTTVKIIVGEGEWVKPIVEVPKNRSKIILTG